MWRGGGGRLRRKRRAIGRRFWEGVVKVDNRAVVSENVGLGKVELPGDDLEELPFNSVHVSLAENTGGESPVDVL